MVSQELLDLIRQIRNMQGESQTVEVKSAHDGCPTRLYDTLSSFSNQDDGGVIVFGLDEKSDFMPVGVYDVQDLQQKVTRQCNEMEPPVRALFSLCDVEGKTIVSAEIPGISHSERPSFYKGKGRLCGSYTRVGDSNEPMTEYEIYSYEAFRKKIRNELRPIPEAKRELFDEERLQNYLRAVKKDRRNLAESVSDSEILELMGITRDGVPTLAGVMVFSKYPQAYFPQLSLTLVRVPGTEMGEVGENGVRFLDNLRATGSISEMLEEAITFVRRNMRRQTIIDGSGKRVDRDEYPVKAVREAILNALVHRDYSVFSENGPVTLEMYEDRLTIRNIGGLYGGVPHELLGKVFPQTRNPALIGILELLGVTENRFSGIPTIRRELKQNGQPEPIFETRHGEFIVTFKNAFQNNISDPESNVQDKNEFKRIDVNISDIVNFCSVPRSRDELCRFTGLSRSYVMQKFIIPAINQGMLERTIPEKPNSSLQRFVQKR